MGWLWTGSPKNSRALEWIAISWCGFEASVGLQITQQPEERQFRKIPDLSPPVTDGPLGLRSHLCKLMLTKHTPSCPGSPSALTRSESIPSVLTKRLLCTRHCDISHNRQQDSGDDVSTTAIGSWVQTGASPLHLSS